MQVWCLCGAKLDYFDDDSNRQMLGLCVSCQETGDARKSKFWTEPEPPEVAKPFKTKDTVENIDWGKKSYKKH